MSVKPRTRVVTRTRPATNPNNRAGPVLTYVPGLPPAGTAQAMVAGYQATFDLALEAVRWFLVGDGSSLQAIRSAAELSASTSELDPALVAIAAISVLTSWLVKLQAPALPPEAAATLGAADLRELARRLAPTGRLSTDVGPVSRRVDINALNFERDNTDLAYAEAFVCAAAFFRAGVGGGTDFTDGPWLTSPNTAAFLRAAVGRGGPVTGHGPEVIARAAAGEPAALVALSVQASDTARFIGLHD